MTAEQLRILRAPLPAVRLVSTPASWSGCSTGESTILERAKAQKDAE